MTMKFTVVCGTCHHQTEYRTTDKEYRELIRTLSLTIQCPQSACRAAIRLRMVDGGSIISEPAGMLRGDAAKARGPVLPGVEHPAASAPDSPPFVRQSATAPPPFAVKPAAAAEPPFRPQTDVRSGPGGNADTPPFAPHVVAVSRQKGAIQRVLGRFSELPQAAQYAILGGMFGLALLILAIPTGPPPKDPKDKAPEKPVSAANPAESTADPAGSVPAEAPSSVPPVEGEASDGR